MSEIWWPSAEGTTLHLLVHKADCVAGGKEGNQSVESYGAQMRALKRDFGVG